MQCAVRHLRDGYVSIYEKSNTCQAADDWYIADGVLCTCRAKAGGRQSAKDATGKTIKSAGSALRRHNEVRVCRVHC